MAEQDQFAAFLRRVRAGDEEAAVELVRCCSGWGSSAKEMYNRAARKKSAVAVQS